MDGEEENSKFEMLRPLPARFLNPIAERKFKLADRIKQSAFVDEKKIQNPENLDEYINDELSALYGQKMALGAVRRIPPKRRSPKKPVKKPVRSRVRRRRLGAFNTVDNGYYYPENSEDDDEENDEEEDLEDEYEEYEECFPKYLKDWESGCDTVIFSFNHS